MENTNDSVDVFQRPSQNPDMSDQGGGGGGIGIAIGAGVGGCALVVGIIAMVIYCYMKARKESAKPNMTKSHDVFSTAASNTQFDLPKRSRVNQYPDPEEARRARRRERDRDEGHVNRGYARHSSDSSSIGSDAEGRDLSPPRVRRPRGGGANGNFSSESSYEDSSSVDDEVIGGSFKMEREIDDRDRKNRSSYKKSRQNDLIDADKPDSSRYRRTDESQRISRRDEFKRNPRSDSPLTIGSLRKHEQITSKDKNDDKMVPSKSNKSRRRETSPSRTYESSEYTQASLTTEGTMTTTSTQRFAKNPSLRRNSPSRSSSHRRYRKDNEKDSTGRRKPRRTRSSDRGDRSDRSDRSRSPGGGSQRSGSSQGSRRSRSSSATDSKRAAKEQAILPIFQDSKKKSSAV